MVGRKKKFFPCAETPAIFYTFFTIPGTSNLTGFLHVFYETWHGASERARGRKE